MDFLLLKSVGLHVRRGTCVEQAETGNKQVNLSSYASAPCITRPLCVEANMLCDEKGYQARNHVSTVVGAFLAFVFIFLLLCLAYTCSPHTFFIC